MNCICRHAAERICVVIIFCVCACQCTALTSWVNRRCLHETQRSTEGLVGRNYFQVVSHSKRVVYFKIPKSGSTSIYHTLMKQGGYHLERGKPALDSNIDYSTYCLFTFVREPLERVISAYYTIRNRHRAKPDSSASYYRSTESQERNFLRFIANLSHSVHLSGGEQHAQSQFESLRPIRLSRYNLSFVGKIESFSEDWSELISTCPQIQPLQGVKKSNFHEGGRAHNSPVTFPSGRICDRPLCSLINRSGVLLNVRRFYANDYDCFQYSRPWPRWVAHLHPPSFVQYVPTIK